MHRTRRILRAALAATLSCALLALGPRAWAQDAGADEGAPEAADPDPDPEADPGTTLRELRVLTRDVFSEEAARRNLFYRVVDALHAVTHEEVIRREAWFGPGDRITDAMLAEYERNLRALGIFGEVEVRRVDNADGSSDVVVDTRDRFSLAVSAGVSSVGGAESYTGSIGESNLFGTGKAVVLSGRHEDGDSSYRVRYYDPQLFGSWHRLTVDFGGSDEGDSYGFDLRRPFKHLHDPWSYGVSGSTSEYDVDYYDAGDTVASVPRDEERFGLYGLRAFGPRQARRHFGLDVRGEQSSFGSTFGSDPGFVDAPADYSELQAGVIAGIDWEADYRVLRGLDALDYDEDVTLGIDASVRAALAARDTDGEGTAHQPLVELDLRAAAEPLRDTYASLGLAGGLRWDAGEVLAYSTRSALHVYQRSLPSQTLAGSLLYELARDDQGLQPQLTLGEDNGLRGYPARQFTGDRRMVLNLEDRWDTGLELWSVRLGLVGFFDVGWIDDPTQELDFGDPLRSAGLGLRFGSSALFGGRVFRVDFAWPLDQVDGEDFGLSISFAAGQVFRFFGNQTALASEFSGIFR